MASERSESQSGEGTSAQVPPRASRGKAAAARKSGKQAAEQQIDKFMKMVGYADPAKRTDNDGWRWFEYGSTIGRAGVVEAASEDGLYLRAESLVMELPTETDEMLPLLRELLEANMTIAGCARLGVSGEGVFVCATLPVAELDAYDVPAQIHAVVALADSFAGGPSHVEPDTVPAAEA